MADPTYVYDLISEQRRINMGSDFFEKMKGLKPDHNLDPDVAFVAILHHDKLPVDQFDQHDALWIKCPKDKEVASLLKAYKKRYQGEGDIVLRHDLQVIEEKTKVTTLATRPPHNFIALEAVRAQDLEMRKAEVLSRPPLTEDTNTANLIRSKSLSTFKDVSGPTIKPYQPRTIRPATSSPTMAVNPQPASPHSFTSSSPQPDQLGWEDFLFERLELHKQDVECGRQPARRYANVLACDKSARDEWLSLHETQKSYFRGRGARITNMAYSQDLLKRRLEHGAFWRFY
ncbi:hypothetical protein EDD36DRAFT_489042 [Exophiala viscosa]|uniref:Uncharacterized protein n=1 Tax=Exophiala viscosa TaxID=2486360 RepID=A0AAN6DSI0_9EURO|nr:hypothetical protein EDD36DRAFT_489042 [Exophiala viscosa]